MWEGLAQIIDRSMLLLKNQTWDSLCGLVVLPNDLFDLVWICGQCATPYFPKLLLGTRPSAVYSISNLNDS